METKNLSLEKMEVIEGGGLGPLHWSPMLRAALLSRFLIYPYGGGSLEC